MKATALPAAFQAPFAKLIQGRNLTAPETQTLFMPLLEGKLPENTARAILLLLADKGETADEILGCLQAIRRLEPPLAHTFPHLMDTCGTGGDQSHSFNISTLAALVIAGAGGQVAKHGNRAISSRSGSSDLMEALGVRLEAKPARMLQAIRECGIGYFHAPYYHPVFKRIQPLRQRLKTRTIFNLLGPLLNPLRLHYQLVGVAKSDMLKTYAAVLKKMPVKQAMICHSRTGLDEVSTTGITDILKIQRHQMKAEPFDSSRHFFHHTKKDSYAGGSVQENRKTALRLLQNQQGGPLRDMILINAAFGLLVCGLAPDIGTGIKKADAALSSGRAYQALKDLIAISKES